MAVKIFLFQANSNLIGYLQLESCKMGKLPVQLGKKEKLNTHKYLCYYYIDSQFVLSAYQLVPLKKKQYYVS